ncbi:MAG: efflux RND transporter periplasmic adaptor subunit [Muribaculaceae bacterium]|nr:efflux RND transporter periplasmic adaptor subunit [Muribaculaceae bacterium]
MKKFFRILMWTIICLIFAGTFVYLFINSGDKDVTYELVSPTVQNIERTTVLTGDIEPRDEIEIKPQISGIISEILVEPGDHVNNGDVIAKIKVIPEATQLSSAESRIRVASISLEEARQTYERTKALYDKKYESREKYEVDLAAYERAKQELEQTNDQLRIVRDGVSAFDTQGSNTLVRATTTGIVLEVPVKVGTSVIQSNTFNDGTTIAKIADMTDLIFKGKIDETEVDLLREGMPVRISVGAIQGSDYPAVIEKIAPMATDDNGTNTFEVKAALKSDQTAKLRAGYSANAAVILEAANDVITIPERVLEYANDSVFVYVLTSGDKTPQTFDKVAVKTGLSNGIDVQLLEPATISTDSQLRGNKTSK